MRSRFEIGMANATRHLLDEIRRMGGNGPVISTNVRLRQDGLPLAELNAARDAMRGAA